MTPTAVGPVTVDKTVFTDGSGTMTSPSLTTSSANDLLVAFVASDGPAQANGQTFTVTGAGLTWTLAIRDNSRFGDSEIWYARASGTLTAQTLRRLRRPEGSTVRLRSSRLPRRPASA